MATEAQRLIAMSMGKITSSRSRRGGINLRQNLLVANVLLKARTVYMMANYESMMKARQAQVSQPQKPVEAEPDSTSDMASDGDVAEEATATDVVDTVDAVDTTDSDSTVTESTEIAERLEPATCDTDKENSSPVKDCTYAQNTPVPSGDNKNCSRCTKRRLTDVDSSQENTKKAKVDCVKSSGDSVEDMKTDGAYLSNLVHRFNSGFTGLLSVNSHYDDDSNRGKGQGLSSDGFVSCSTQMKDNSFESISVQPIALAV